MSDADKHETAASDPLTTLPINDNLRTGLELLWRAYTYAQDAQADLWDFALEINELYDAGVTISDVRWLLAKGLAEHGRETSVYGDTHRSIRPSPGLNFVHRSCLALTEKGAAFACRVLKESHAEAQTTETTETGATPARQSDSPAADETNGPQAAPKPHWDAIQRELSLGEMLVKRFRVPAANQELILSAFEEESWPAHMDDPLPNTDGIVPQHRLHDTINRLNGNQVNCLLHFHGNGNGDGVYWEVCDVDRIPANGTALCESNTDTATKRNGELRQV